MVLAGRLQRRRIAVGLGGTAPSHADEVLSIIDHELADLAGGRDLDGELAIARGNLAAELLLSGEDSGARMARLGASLLQSGRVRRSTRSWTYRLGDRG